MKHLLKKFLTITVVLSAVILIFASCGNNNTEGKYQPKYKYTDEKGVEIYEWPDADEQGTIDVEGGKISYRLYGKGKKGIPLICLHGGPGGNYTCFYKQLPHAEDRPILLYQQIGSAETEIYSEYQTPDKLATIFSIEHMTKDLDTIIHHFKFSEYVLYGSSWGTMLAAEYASKYKPNGLKAIIMAGPFLDVDRWINDQEKLFRSLDNGDKMISEIRKCEQTGIYTDLFNEYNEIYTNNFNARHPENTKDKPQMLGYDGLAQPKYNGVTCYEYMWGKSEFSCTGTLKHHNSIPCLKNIKVPILFIAGQYDEAVTDTVEYYVSESNNAEMAIIPDTGHAASNERPDEVAVIIKGFLSRI